MANVVDEVKAVLARLEAKAVAVGEDVAAEVRALAVKVGLVAAKVQEQADQVVTDVPAPAEAAPVVVADDDSAASA